MGDYYHTFERFPRGHQRPRFARDPRPLPLPRARVTPRINPGTYFAQDREDRGNSGPDITARGHRPLVRAQHPRSELLLPSRIAAGQPRAMHSPAGANTVPLRLAPLAAAEHRRLHRVAHAGANQLCVPYRAAGEHRRMHAAANAEDCWLRPVHVAAGEPRPLRCAAHAVAL